MPADATAEAQSDAYVCLLDALNIRSAAGMGGLAGPLSALQMAIRHPERFSARILLVPLVWKPPSAADSAAPMPPWVEATMLSVIGSNVLFWSALHLARGPMIASVLTEALGLELRRPPSDSACRYLFRQVAVAALGAVISEWTITRSKAQLGLFLLMMVLLPLQMLSGGVTQRENMSERVRTVMLAAPDTHFVRLAQVILFRGPSVAMVWPQFLSLVLIESVFCGVAHAPFSTPLRRWP